MASSGLPRTVTSHSTQPADPVLSTARVPHARAGSWPPLPAAGFREWLGCLLGLRTRLVVSNNSMLPHIRPGDRLFLDPRAYRRSQPRQGDVVVAQHPLTDELILKRVTRVTAAGDLFLRGDNPDASCDSRQLGWFALPAIRGRVTSRVPGI